MRNQRSNLGIPACNGMHPRLLSRGVEPEQRDRRLGEKAQPPGSWGGLCLSSKREPCRTPASELPKLTNHLDKSNGRGSRDERSLS